jgi:hypothetical protein
MGDRDAGEKACAEQAGLSHAEKAHRQFTIEQDSNAIPQAGYHQKEPTWWHEDCLGRRSKALWLGILYRRVSLVERGPKYLTVTSPQCDKPLYLPFNMRQNAVVSLSPRLSELARGVLSLSTLPATCDSGSVFLGDIR